MSDERNARVHMALIKAPAPGAPTAPEQRSMLLRRRLTNVSVPPPKVAIPLGSGFGLGPFGLGRFGGTA